MLLATELTNLLNKEADNRGIDVVIKLKNSKIDGEDVACSGFITNISNSKCVYINTESILYYPVVERVYYRPALNEDDHGFNTSFTKEQYRLCPPGDSAKCIVDMLL